jgi:hypothetical protein
LSGHNYNLELGRFFDRFSNSKGQLKIFFVKNFELPAHVPKSPLQPLKKKLTSLGEEYSGDLGLEVF